MSFHAANPETAAQTDPICDSFASSDTVWD